jgi:hypothetical protein
MPLEQCVAPPVRSIFVPAYDHQHAFEGHLQWLRDRTGLLPKAHFSSRRTDSTLLHIG